MFVPGTKQHSAVLEIVDCERSRSKLVDVVAELSKERLGAQYLTDLAKVPGLERDRHKGFPQHRALQLLLVFLLRRSPFLYPLMVSSSLNTGANERDNEDDCRAALHLGSSVRFCSPYRSAAIGDNRVPFSTPRVFRCDRGMRVNSFQKARVPFSTSPPSRGSRKMAANSFWKVRAVTLIAGCFFVVLLCGSVNTSAERRLTAAHSESVSWHSHHERHVPANLPGGEEASHAAYPVRVSEEMRRHSSIQGIKSRSPTQTLADWRSASLTRFSKPRATALRPSAAAILIAAALLATFLPTGRVLKGQQGNEKLPHSTVAPAVGLPSSPISDKILLALNVLTVLSFALAIATTPAVHTEQKRPPPVDAYTNENGSTLVRIGKNWTGIDGLVKTGAYPFFFTSNGSRYVLWLSNETENALGGNLWGLRRALGQPPQLDQHNGSQCVWGSREAGGATSPFHAWSNSSGGLQCEVFLPPKIAEALREGEARNDFLELVETFFKAFFLPRAGLAGYPVGESGSSTALPKEGIVKTAVSAPKLAWSGGALRETRSGYPSVRVGKLVGGEEVVLIGRDWTSEKTGRRKQGHNPILTTFGGRKFLVFLSLETELHLMKQEALSGVLSALSGAPRCSEAGNTVCWKWSDSSPNSTLFKNYTNTAGNVGYQFYFPDTAAQWLMPENADPKVPEAREDMVRVLDVFTQELMSPSAPAGGVSTQQNGGHVHTSTPALETHSSSSYQDTTTAAPATSLQTFTTKPPAKCPRTPDEPRTSEETPTTAPAAATVEPVTTEAPMTSLETSTTTSVEPFTSGAPSTPLETSATGAPTTPVHVPTSTSTRLPVTTTPANLNEEVGEVDLKFLEAQVAEEKELSGLYYRDHRPSLRLYRDADGTRTWLVGREWTDPGVKAARVAVQFQLDGKTRFIVLLTEPLAQALRATGVLNKFVNSLRTSPTTPAPPKTEGPDEMVVHWGNETDPYLSPYMTRGVTYFAHVPVEVLAFFIRHEDGKKDVSKEARFHWNLLFEVTVLGIVGERSIAAQEVLAYTTGVSPSWSPSG